ncbi:MAG: hypothetical protein K9I82_15755 [Chitinophagaceae bacterium]|nr:hypothetical protein [Chitinophagaceae bacterium]
MENNTNKVEDKKVELTYDELLTLLKEAYRNGYATYEVVDAGLESYDADGYARWVLLGITKFKNG